MKRDPRLRLLSSDHHRALVMARKMERAAGRDGLDPTVLREIQAFCHDELRPHLAQEEEILLPALERHGEHALVERTIGEHAQMMELVTSLEQKGSLLRLSELLKQHVRFEEQQLFEVSQRKLTDAELDAIAEAGTPSKAVARDAVSRPLA